MFIVEGLHKRTCPKCGGQMTFYGDKTSSGGSCLDCDYAYIDAEPHHSDEQTVTYDELLQD